MNYIILTKEETQVLNEQGHALILRDGCLYSVLKVSKPQRVAGTNLCQVGSTTNPQHADSYVWVLSSNCMV